MNLRLEPYDELKYRRIAICGHVNVGKSSFFNALIADRISTVKAKASSALPIFVKFGETRAAFVRDQGHLKRVDEDIARSHTFDDRIEPEWTGLVWELPRPFLRRYNLIDTPGLGDERVDQSTMRLLSKSCEFRLVLFNKPDASSLAPIKKLNGLPLLAIRTQADDPEESLADYLVERTTTFGRLQRYSEGLPIPFIYASVKDDCERVGSVFVPHLAERLDIVFAYRALFLRCTSLLAKIDRAESELKQSQAVLTPEEAAAVYAGWYRVKKELDQIKRRLEPTISSTDAELLSHLVSIPLGQAAWRRITTFYGLPPVNIGQPPNQQYRVLEAWFLRIESRMTLERRLQAHERQSAIARRDITLLLSLAAALVTRELGDVHSMRLLLKPFDELAEDVSSNWRAYAAQLWEA